MTGPFRLAPLVLLLFALLVVAPARAAVDIERIVSPGGIEAWLVEDATVPVVSVEVAFRGGSALDPDGKEGLANMVAALLDEGAGDLDSQAFQSRLEELAVSLSFDAGADAFHGSMRTLTKTRDEAFRLLGLAVTEPRFDPEAVERIRSQILTSLARDTQDPGYIAQRVWYRTLFPDHPYGRPMRGTPGTVRAITVDDLVAFDRRRLARDGLLVAVVGDISADELAPLLDSTFGGLPAKSASGEVPDVTPRAEGEIIVVERDVPQSEVRFGHGGIKRDDPDFYAAYVLNYILGGGGFTSRLLEEVREKRGLAYSVYSYLRTLDHAGLVVGGVGTRNEAVGRTLEIIRAEWRRMRTEGPTEEELEGARTYLTGSFPLRLDSTRSIAQILMRIRLDRLGIDYINRREDLIEGVTLDDVRRVAQRLLHPDALTFAIVGRPAGVEATRPAPDLPDFM